MQLLQYKKQEHSITTRDVLIFKEGHQQRYLAKCHRLPPCHIIVVRKYKHFLSLFLASHPLTLSLALPHSLISTCHSHILSLRCILILLWLLLLFCLLSLLLLRYYVACFVYVVEEVCVVRVQLTN